MSILDYQRINLIKICFALNNRPMISKRVAEWCCRYVAIDANYYLTDCLAGCETPDLALRVIKRLLRGHPELFFQNNETAKWFMFPHVRPDVETFDPVVPALFVTPSMRVETVALLPAIRLLSSRNRRVAAPRAGSLIDPLQAYQDTDSEDDDFEERNRRRRRDADDDETMPRAQRARR